MTSRRTCGASWTARTRRAEGRREFTRWFIRPCGLDVPASEVVASVIETVARPQPGARADVGRGSASGRAGSEPRLRGHRPMSAIAVLHHRDSHEEPHRPAPQCRSQRARADVRRCRGDRLRQQRRAVCAGRGEDRRRHRRPACALRADQRQALDARQLGAGDCRRAWRIRRHPYRSIGLQAGRAEPRACGDRGQRCAGGWLVPGCLWPRSGGDDVQAAACARANGASSPAPSCCATSRTGIRRLAPSCCPS